MRPLIYAINLTLDGCCDHTKGMADEESHRYHIQLLQESDTLLYGRKTFELMVPFWPDIAMQPGNNASMNEFASAFVTVPEIVVFSRTLTTADDHKTRIVSADLREQIMLLKKQPGKAILTGGVALPAQLISLDLVDEFCFLIQPLIVGEGRRLPPAALDTQQLQLVGSMTFKSGTVALRYRKKPVN